MTRFLAVILALVLGASETSRAETCSLHQLAVLPMLNGPGRSPVVPVLLDGQPRRMMIDTGGAWSTLDQAIGQNYDVHWPGVEIRGVDGEPLTQAITVPSLGIDKILLKGTDFFLSDAALSGSYGALGGALRMEFDGTLGGNILKDFDVEIDPITHKVLLFSQDHCEGQVVHWVHADVAVLPVDFDRRQNVLTVPVKLNGQVIEALIDTGAAETILDLDTAQKLFGLTKASPGVMADAPAEGMGGKLLRTYRYRFDSLVMGGITFRSPEIALVDLAAAASRFRVRPGLVIGMHQLAPLHLYFAYDERKLYVSNTRADSALNAPAEPQESRKPDAMDIENIKDLLKDADAAKAAGDFDRALAIVNGGLEATPTSAELKTYRAYLLIKKRNYADALNDVNSALKADSGYIAAYINRAAIMYAQGKVDAALQDLSEALRHQPNNVDALMERSHVYYAQHQYWQALNDVDIASLISPKSAAVRNEHCWLAAILDRLDGALQDCNAAFAIEPNDPAILDSRAFVYLKLNRLDDAIADYNAALEIAPHLVNSLYGRGLARKRRGDTVGGDADIAAAEKIDATIAARFGK